MSNVLFRRAGIRCIEELLKIGQPIGGPLRPSADSGDSTNLTDLERKNSARTDSASGAEVPATDGADTAYSKQRSISVEGRPRVLSPLK